MRRKALEISLGVGVFIVFKRGKKAKRFDTFLGMAAVLAAGIRNPKGDSRPERNIRIFPRQGSNLPRFFDHKAAKTAKWSNKPKHINRRRF
jgi:hypothetical protein